MNYRFKCSNCGKEILYTKNILPSNFECSSCKGKSFKRIFKSQLVCSTPNITEQDLAIKEICKGNNQSEDLDYINTISTEQKTEQRKQQKTF